MDSTRLLDSMNEYMEQINYVDEVNAQYGIEAYVMSQRGYNQILGDNAKIRKLIIYIILGFGIVLIAESENALEYKSGMNMLLGSSARGRIWGKAVKSGAVCIIAAIIAVIVNITEMSGFYESWENAEIHNDKTVYDYAAWGIYLIFFTGIDRNYGCIKIYI